jgi:hypothetical protein
MWASRLISSRILKVDAKTRRMVSFTLQPIYWWWRSPQWLLKYAAEWVPYRVRTFWNVAYHGRTSVVQPVTQSLYWICYALLISYLCCFNLRCHRKRRITYDKTTVLSARRDFKKLIILVKYLMIFLYFTNIIMKIYTINYMKHPQIRKNMKLGLGLSTHV